MCPYCQLTDPCKVFSSLFPCVCMEASLHTSAFSLKWNYSSAQSRWPPQNNSFDALIRDNGPSKV